MAGGAVAEHLGFAALHLGAAANLAVSLLYPMVAVRQRDVTALEIDEEAAVSPPTP